MNDNSLDKEFLSIKEFAELVGISIDTLRHYDKKDLFRPAKRGIDFENKYQYYTPTQITTIKMICILTEIGVPLETIKEVSQYRTPEKMMRLLLIVPPPISPMLSGRSYWRIYPENPLLPLV